MKSFLLLVLISTAFAEKVTPLIPYGLDRPFISGDIWANPMKSSRLLFL